MMHLIFWSGLFAVSTGYILGLAAWHIFCQPVENREDKVPIRARHWDD